MPQPILPKNSKTTVKRPVLLTAVGFQLSSSIESSTPHTDDTARTFSGIANSGKPFLDYGYGGGERCIIDLSTLEYKDKVPVLDMHDRDKRVGFAQLSVTADGLQINGQLLNNEYGSALAADSDEGFPLELSVHAQAGSVEYVESGQDIVINGQTYQGEITVMRNCKIREVSFTPTGADDNTHVAILSDNAPVTGGKTNTEYFLTTEETSMTTEEMQAEIDRLKKENADLKAEIKTLKSQLNKSDTDSKLSQAGFKQDDNGDFAGISKATYNVLLSADSDSRDAMIADLTPQAPVKDEQGQQRGQQSAPDWLLSETTPPKGDNEDTTDDIDKYLTAKGAYL